MNVKLLKNISWVITMDNEDNIFEHMDLLIENNRITKIEKNIDVSDIKDKVQIIDCDGMAVLPGFINTHHHLYQSLFRGMKEVQDMPLFPWLEGLYEFWKHIDSESVYYGAMVSLSELVRTGCTTTSDHHYIFPRKANTTLIDEEIKAARDIGIRFHATRGSMSLGRDEGGLPPSSAIQSEEEILLDSERLIDKYHDYTELAMTRIALAPCSPFSVTKNLMWETKKLARKKGVMLHTHLCETVDEEMYCRERYDKTPVELMEELEWIGSDVWFAHGIYLSDREIKTIQGAGIAHCPTSNMKLGSGICKTSELIKAGIPVGIGVDGSASNDGSNMWEEVRRTYLLNHLKYGNTGLSAYEVLKMATKGGAEVLGRNDIGRLEVNKAADMIAIDLKDISFTGCEDPIVAIVCCGNSSFVKYTIINGEIVFKDGVILTMNYDNIINKANSLSKEIINRGRNLKSIN
ncbi:8-oxoguanine deaminase [uncultured Clostridium sp.]|uniref:8-oxoguanine deaminase n=1 Tax=uncultured Clostridium sp. TaxID=59620 RepID=UPI00321625C9